MARRLLFPLSGSAGVSQSETCSAVDVSTVQVSFSGGVAEVVNAIETTNGIVGSTTIAESAGAAETISALLIAALAIVESASATDSSSASGASGISAIPAAFLDRIRDTTSSTGFGAITLSGTAPAGFRSFSAVPNGQSLAYVIASQGGSSEWEVVRGRYSSAGGGSLSRDQIFASSNGNAAVNFSAGVKDVFLTGLAATLQPGYWNIKTDFGAKGDAVRLTDVSMSAGSSTIASNGAAFTAADAGKAIGVVGAGTAGANLVGAISSVTDAHHVVASFSAITAVSNGQAVYGTDDTAAFQAALDAAYVGQKGNRIRVPTGNYFIAGPLLQTSTRNAQVLFPENNGSLPKCTIEFFGDMPQADTLWTSGNVLLTYGGSIIHSLASASASGWNGAAIFGGGLTGGSYPYSWVYLRFINLAFRLYPNPSIGAINAQNIATLHIDECTVDSAQGDLNNIAQPSFDVAAIAWNVTNSPDMKYCGKLVVTGFPYGASIWEHFRCAHLVAFRCRVGLMVYNTYHPAIVERFGAIHCKYGVYAGAGSGGHHRIKIGQMYIEQDSGKWYSTTDLGGSGYDIYDPSSQIDGFIDWTKVLGGSGQIHTFSVNGGANLTLREF